MRISDWSSDVCSSDLLDQGPSFRAALGLDDNLQINRSYTDIVFREERPEGVVFRIVDIKATRKSTAFHKAQVEFRSEEHTSEIQSLMRISYAVSCLKKKIL